MPPRMIASRAEGGNDGGLPWRIRVFTAARKSAVWPAKYWAPPSISHAQRT